MIYGRWEHCNLVKLKDDFTGFEQYEDDTVFKEITPEGYVEGSCSLSEMINIILCGLKAGGVGLITR